MTDELTKSSPILNDIYIHSIGLFISLLIIIIITIFAYKIIKTEAKDLDEKILVLCFSCIFYIIPITIIINSTYNLLK